MQLITFMHCNTQLIELFLIGLVVKSSSTAFCLFSFVVWAHTQKSHTLLSVHIQSTEVIYKWFANHAECDVQINNYLWFWISSVDSLQIWIFTLKPFFLFVFDAVMRNLTKFVLFWRQDQSHGHFDVVIIWRCMTAFSLCAMCPNIICSLGF